MDRDPQYSRPGDEGGPQGRFVERYEYLLIYIAVVSTLSLIAALIWR